MKEYVYARLVELVEASISEDALMVFDPTRNFFTALNALTPQEVLETFNHPVLLMSYGIGRVAALQAAYAKHRLNSEVKNE